MVYSSTACHIPGVTKASGKVFKGFLVFFGRLPHFLGHGLVAVQQGDQLYAARPYIQKPNVVLSVGGEHSCCPFVVGLSVCCCQHCYYTTTQLVVKSYRLFFKISKGAAFVVDRSFRSTHILYHAPTLLQARLATFF